MPGPTITAAQLFLTWEYTPSNSGSGSNFGGGCSITAGVGLIDPTPNWTHSTAVWAKRTDSTGIDGHTPVTYDLYPYLDFIPDLLSGDFYVLLMIENDGLFVADFSPPEQLLIYDCYVQTTYSDDSVQVWRPTAYATDVAATGSIANPQAAYDGNPTTYATLLGSGYGSGFGGVFLNLNTWQGSTSPTLSCNNPPPATWYSPYSHSLTVSGGTSPYMFALVSGSLPPGLSLNTSTGVISGTPTAGGGTYTFTVQVTDAASATAQVTCSISVALPYPTSAAAIDNIWESGLVRDQGEFQSTMIRVGGADVWVRGSGPLLPKVWGPDHVQSLTPPLLLNTSTLAPTLSANPGQQYLLIFDLDKVENCTVQFETNALNAWFELSGFQAFMRPSLFNR